MAYQIPRKLSVTELHLTGGCGRADDLLVHANDTHRHKMLCLKFCRQLNPNMYWPIYYIPYFLVTNFTSDLHSQTQNTFNET